jgi:hypothetical protein
VERKSAAVSKTVLSLTGDRGFESIPLQRRVGCELPTRCDGSHRGAARRRPGHEILTDDTQIAGPIRVLDFRSPAMIRAR